LSTKRIKHQPRPQIAGVFHANIQLPESLHEAMKAIRQARHELEGADVKLCRIYREAVEQYVNGKAQQKFLTRGQKAMRIAG
jgi:hypothetical protein